MMNLIEKKGTLGVRGHAILCVLIGLLVSEASSQAADGELSSLKLKLDLLKTHYREMCDHYSKLAPSCSAPAFNCTECPDGWLHVGDQCFILETDRQNWLNSTDKCAEIGGHLATLTTREQHEAVEKEARANGNAFYTYYWIGLTDIEKEGDWKWADKSALKNSFWSKVNSEPDNHQSGGAEGEDCVVVDSYTQSWYDVMCSFEYPRICQKDANPLV